MSKIIGIIKCMSEEEREVVIFALEEIYGRGAENEEEQNYSIVNK